MPFDGDGIYHFPKRRRSVAQLKIEEHDRMGDVLPENMPASERLERKRLLAVNKPVNEMDPQERCEHFGALTSSELYEAAHSEEAIRWDHYVLYALCLAMASRLKGLQSGPPNPCHDPANSACCCASCEAVEEQPAVGEAVCDVAREQKVSAFLADSLEGYIS